MLMSLSWTGVVSVSMLWARGRPRSPLVEQHGLADPGELADQLAHGQVQRRTLVPGAGD